MKNHPNERTLQRLRTRWKHLTPTARRWAIRHPHRTERWLYATRPRETPDDPR